MQSLDPGDSVPSLNQFDFLLFLVTGAVMFVKPMRNMGCLTLLDPFQNKYGDKIGALLFIPSIMGDFFWVGSILSALGKFHSLCEVCMLPNNEPESS